MRSAWRVCGFVERHNFRVELVNRRVIGGDEPGLALGGELIELLDTLRVRCPQFVKLGRGFRLSRHDLLSL